MSLKRENMPLIPPDVDSSDEDEDLESRCCLFLFVCPWRPTEMRRKLRENGLILDPPEGKRSQVVDHLQRFPMHNIVKPVVLNQYRHIGGDASTAMLPYYSQIPREGPKFSSGGSSFDSKVLLKEMLNVRRKHGPETWQKSGLTVAVKFSARPKKWHVWSSVDADYVFGCRPRRNSPFYYVTVNDNNAVVLEKGNENLVVGSGSNRARLFKLMVVNKKEILQHTSTKMFLAYDLIKGQNRLKLVPMESQAEEWRFL